MNLPARYINHSCDPNVGVGGLNEFGSYDFLALEDIESDEVRLLLKTCHCHNRSVLKQHHINKFITKELKFDYETTEYEIGAFSECLCGSHNCRGSIHVSANNHLFDSRICLLMILSRIFRDTSIRVM